MSRWRTCFPLKIGDASSCRWKDHSQASLAFCCWLHWWDTFPLKVKEKLNPCSSLWDLKGVQWSTATCISISNATPRTMKPHQLSVALWLTLAYSNTHNNKVFFILLITLLCHRNRYVTGPTNEIWTFTTIRNSQDIGLGLSAFFQCFKGSAVVVYMFIHVFNLWASCCGKTVFP